MTDFHVALKTLLDSAPRAGTEQISLTGACDRVLAQDVLTPEDMPPFSKSAMDGYACRSEDISEGMRMLEMIPAGRRPRHTIIPGTCSKIMTGAMIPEGADTVLIVEKSTIRDGLVYGTPSAVTNIMVQGEDLKKGDRVMEKGTVLRPQHLALLAACGIDLVTVSQKIPVGILSTGNELAEPGQVTESGKIFNSNAWSLMAMASGSGGIPSYYGIASDTLEDTRCKLSRALENNWVVLISGGVSEGDYDHVPAAIRELGFEILFDRVRVQPGKPTTFAVSGETGKYIFGLPGNPVSSFVQCLLMVKPFLSAMQGARTEPVAARLPLKGHFRRRNSGRMAHIPLRINPEGTCTPLPYNGSAHLASLASAHALGRIPVGIDRIEEGETIEVLFFY